MNGSESGWVTIDETPRRVDLLTLQGGVTDTLAAAELPVGTLNQLRLVVSAAEVFLSDGRSFPLDVPSGDTSGIKVFPTPPIEIVGDLTTELLLDFDVSQSFEAIPNSPRRAEEIERFHFHPVLRVANLSSTGRLEGKVYDDAGTLEETNDDVPIEGADVTLTRGDLVVASSGSGTDGGYKLLGISPGPGTLIASATGYDAASVEVEVVAGNEVSQSFRLHATSPRAGRKR